MNTPIYDFVKSYANGNPVRMHMPGHKGELLLGVESLDITEFDGADDLYHADGIIKESELNASKLFNAHTFYSTEGASLAIRSMLYLAFKFAKAKGLSPVILAGRNAHKSFISASALIGFDIEWLLPNDCSNYLSCKITPEYLDEVLSKCATLPFAVYLTAPDYLGNLADIKGISAVCKKHGVLLLVDNAHGAYLKFLTPSLHPIDCGADMCTDSAHKTLPTLTGGAYLHIALSAEKEFVNNAKSAMSLFASTSPSYLILQSLDLTNAFLADGFAKKLENTIYRTNILKEKLTNKGYSILQSEPLKITIFTKEYGYSGQDFSKILKSENILVEFYDNDQVTLMISTKTKEEDFITLERVLFKIEKLPKITTHPPKQTLPKKSLSVRKAIFSVCETVNIENAENRILSDISVACPPAVPIVVSGEVIDKNAIELFKYYGVKTCKVVK